jgi:ATP-dependent helicase/nuclease subunit A
VNTGQDFLRTALDPSHSVVVDACAGSGKTWLLVSRVIRLLLAGVAPSEILAITFTRKAAQEMRARLIGWLRKLALGSDDEVIAFLRERAVPEPDIPAALLRARGLFETCLNAQPGITIDTFHGWFLQLLERAPLNADAGVPGDFVLEERVSLLTDEAWDRFGAALEDSANAHVAAKFAELAADLGYTSLRKLLGRFLHRRAEWWAYTAGQDDSTAFALAELRQLLGVDPDGDPARDLLDDPVIKDCLDIFAALDSTNSKTQARFAQSIQDARAQQDAGQAFLILFAGCHTKEGAPQKNLTSFYAKQAAELSARFDAFCLRLQATRALLEELAVYRLHERALPCGVLLLDVLQQLKRARQIIDFTDIEWMAYRLLASGEDAAFMHAKLDSRYRHILLDEFQDTNPLQWQALRAWLDAYGDAAGRPSVFLVGDPKQSIYRFRRAEPRLFEVAAETFVKDYGAARLITSTTRRCAPEIVDVVNAMFEGKEDYPGFLKHVAHDATPGGRVEVLPLFHQPPVQAVEAGGDDWRDPLKLPLRDREDLRRNLEAAALAARIRDIVGNWEVVDAAGPRPARYADIMILKRNRVHLPAYEHALRVQGIPFLTSRLGGLLGTLEAADLCALIEVLIAPFDDLKLAHALRSPVFACSDDDLIYLAKRAAGSVDKATWWQCLAEIAPEAGANLRRAHRLLVDWRADADAAPVHDLLDRIYHEGDVVRRYRAASPVATQGQVTANLQRFLELALELDSGRYPSLPRFVAELARLREVPDQEAPDEGQEAPNDEAGVPGERGLDAVRILTVHGAKGLEAPLVWLIDAQEGQRSESYDVLIDWLPEALAPQHFSLFTVNAARGHRRDRFFQTQSDLAARERLNLLYVAATRARRYLMVSGVEPEKAAQRTTTNAYERFATAIDTVATSRGEPQVLVVGEAAIAAPSPSPVFSAAGATPAPPPSRFAYGKRVAQSEAGRVGSLLHRALEFAGGKTTGSEAEDRGLVARRALGLSETEFAPLWGQALGIVNAPGLRRFFDATQFLRAENELEFIGETGLKRIDRVIEFDDEVWVLDYKSGGDDRPAWVVQLANYRNLLKLLFANKKIRTAVVLADGGLEEFSE